MKLLKNRIKEFENLIKKLKNSKNKTIQAKYKEAMDSAKYYKMFEK